MAPCGMNCNLCLAYPREKKRCPGYNSVDSNKSDYRIRFIIKNCEILKQNKWRYYSSKCQKYPCTQLKILDNLNCIEKYGIRDLMIQEENQDWYSHRRRIFCRKNYSRLESKDC
jgi:hypothetical protein